MIFGILGEDFTELLSIIFDGFLNGIIYFESAFIF